MFFFHVTIALFVSIKTRPDFATSSDSKIFGFASLHDSKLFADSKISTLERGSKKVQISMRIRRIRVDERRIRKENVADSEKYPLHPHEHVEICGIYLQLGNLGGVVTWLK